MLCLRIITVLCLIIRYIVFSCLKKKKKKKNRMIFCFISNVVRIKGMKNPQGVRRSYLKFGRDLKFIMGTSPCKRNPKFIMGTSPCKCNPKFALRHIVKNGRIWGGTIKPYDKYEYNLCLNILAKYCKASLFYICRTYFILQFK